MAATAKCLARGLLPSAALNLAYTTPASQVTRVTRITVFSFHSATVIVRIQLGPSGQEYYYYQQDLLPNESMSLSMDEFLNAAERVSIYTDVGGNVIAYHISGIEDVNG